ncbi:MAG: histidinol-phosphate transaminase [Coriobacteriales bacterium]|jgi:histidinol-phosphate aminotransferase|nr:histidinol-phosphate transaminase [Coriobacteriales bacterium]
MQWDKFFRSNLEPVEAYVPGLREEQIKEIAQVDTIYKLSSNESPFPPFPTAIAAMADQLVRLNEYPDGSSYELTLLLSHHYGIAQQQIICGNGSNELIDQIAQTCLEPGDEALYCWPSFVVYRSSTQIAGADRRELPLRQDGSYDLAALKAAITDRTKIIYICSPNNPTGGLVTQAELADFLSDLPDHLLVVFDAAYEEFVDDDYAARPLDFYDGVRPFVVLRTFSKMYSLAGIRVGYGFAPEPLVEQVNKVRAPFNVNSIAQAAARASLGDEKELTRRRALNTAGRERLYDCFDQLNLPYFKSHGNFIWVTLPDAMSTFDQLLARGIIVRSFDGAPGLRVGVGDELAVSKTIQAFEELFG